ncbi:hypothetical protein K144313037_12410 [Clostridium tetani]|uniref:transposase n=1 Tax=Clostridium tetani TaxID=1513 RepID=UPI00100A3EA8|nr:transposase [Clostridium tetani]RXM58807.1 transposase [Clostridium tetani]BDR64380.1 hypothetical protein K134307016_13140 [Clostridium tetani]BDR69829.1 hypothetical protein K144313037_12410 [Clostridium tetani]BDR72575.1 hypothetical protein K144316041_12830 [Clostridium tetani]BEV19466.1 hypothetical protein K154301001_13210 [Clostridium tetani]
MKKTKRRNYIVKNCRIIIKKFTNNMTKYIVPTISSLISNILTALITKRVFSKNTLFKPMGSNIKKSTDIYFLILSAMLLLTYYYLHKC